MIRYYLYAGEDFQGVKRKEPVGIGRGMAFVMLEGRGWLGLVHFVGGRRRGGGNTWAML